MKDLKGSMAPLEKQTVLNISRNSSLVGFSCSCYMTSEVLSSTLICKLMNCNMQYNNAHKGLFHSCFAVHSFSICSSKQQV